MKMSATRADEALIESLIGKGVACALAGLPWRVAKNKYGVSCAQQRLTESQVDNLRMELGIDCNALREKLIGRNVDGMDEVDYEKQYLREMERYFDVGFDDSIMLGGDPIFSTATQQLMERTKPLLIMPRIPDDAIDGMQLAYEDFARMQEQSQQRQILGKPDEGWPKDVSVPRDWSGGKGQAKKKPVEPPAPLVVKTRRVINLEE